MSNCEAGGWSDKIKTHNTHFKTDKRKPSTVKTTGCPSKNFKKNSLIMTIGFL